MDPFGGFPVAFTADPLPGDVGLCAMCNRPVGLRCQRCASAMYCSKECYTANWPSHKLLCEAYQGVKQARPNQVRCIFFPHDQRQPLFMFCPTRADGQLDIRSIGALVGEDFQTMAMDTNNRLRRNLSRSIRLYHSANPTNDTALNQAILAATCGTAVLPYSNRFIAVVFTESEDETTGVEVVRHHDANMADFRNIVDGLAEKPQVGRLDQTAGKQHTGLVPYLIEENAKVIGTNADGHTMTIPLSIHCAKLNCNSEIKSNNIPRLEPVTIGWCHDLFTRGDYSELSSLVWQSLMCIRTPTTTPRNVQGPVFDSPALSWLMIDLRPGKTFASVPLEYGSLAGNAIFARRDYAAIDLEFIEPLLDFAQYHVRALSRRYASKRASAATEAARTEQMLSEITPQKYVQYVELRRELLQARRPLADKAGLCLCGSEFHDGLA